MKRTIAIAALCAGIMLTTFPCQAKESGNVKINAKNFPDTIVREYVSEKIDKNNGVFPTFFFFYVDVVFFETTFHPAESML